MFRIFTFLSTYRNLFVFLILEGIALTLIVRHNDYQRHQVGDAALAMSGWVNELSAGVSQYFTMGEANGQLSQENILLHEQINELRKRLDAYEGIIARDTLRQLSIDSLVSRESYELSPCRVIRSTTNLKYNYITLDKGSMEGVKVGMGVISPQGIVGKVIQTSDHYSLVLSGLNVGFSLLVKAVTPGTPLSNGHVGIYEWDGNTPFEAKLTFIPETVELKVGDQIVTSGYRTIFPSGYLVGEIARLNDSKDGYHDAVIKLSTDYHALGNVYLVSATHKSTLDSLEQSIPR